MRKKLFWSVMTVFIALTGCEKNNDTAEKEPIAISDAGFKSFLVNQFDADNDGEISVAEAKAVTRIDLSAGAETKAATEITISSLEGLDYFCNLREFIYNRTGYHNVQFDANLHTIDLSGNKSLEVVEFKNWGSIYNDIEIKLPESVVTVDYYKSNGAIKSFNWSMSYPKMTSLTIDPDNSGWSSSADGMQKTYWDLSKFPVLKSLSLGMSDSDLTFNAYGTTFLSESGTLSLSRASGSWVMNENDRLTLKVITASGTCILKANAFSGYTVVCTKDEIVISDAGFKSFLVSQFDTDKDGEISVAEAKAVTRIDLSDTSNTAADSEITFSSLDGLDNFCNLREFIYNRIGYHYVKYSENLHTIDLSGNKSLEVVEFKNWSSIYNDFEIKLPESVVTVDYYYSNGAIEKFDWTKSYPKMTSLTIEPENSGWTSSKHGMQKTYWDLSKFPVLKSLSLGMSDSDLTFNAYGTSFLSESGKLSLSRASGSWVMNENDRLTLKVITASGTCILKANAFDGYTVVCTKE